MSPLSSSGREATGFPCEVIGSIVRPLSMYQTAFLFCLLQPAGDDEGQGTGATPTVP